MKQYRIQCGGLTITAQQESAGWLSVLEGLGEKYIFPALDGETAKNARIHGAKAILAKRGSPIPDCLSNPHWTTNEPVKFSSCSN